MLIHVKLYHFFITLGVVPLLIRRVFSPRCGSGIWDTIVFYPELA